MALMVLSAVQLKFNAVMDSSLADHKDFTQYIEKSRFEHMMSYEGDYVVVPFKKQ